MLLTQILSSHEKPIITAFLTPASSRLWFVMARVKVQQQQINIDNHVQKEVSGAMHEFVAFKIYCQLNVMMQQFLKSCLVIIQNYFIFITVSHWLGWWLVALFSGRKVSGVIFQFPIVSPLLSPGPASAASWKWAAVDNISCCYSEGKIIWTLPPIVLLPKLRWFFVSWPWRWFVSVFANMKLLMTLSSLCNNFFLGTYNIFTVP